MTQGLSRVEELFEARNPKITAEVADIDGVITIKHDDAGAIVQLTSTGLNDEEYYFAEDLEVLVREGQEIKEKHVIARHKTEKQKVVAGFAGIVKKISKGMIVVKDSKPRSFDYRFEL